MSEQQQLTFNPPTEEIDIDKVEHIPVNYPSAFLNFCTLNQMRPPRFHSNAGKALRTMLAHPSYYWTRTSCDAFVKKFNLTSKDSIQMFNKHAQWGLCTNSGTDRERYYVVYPYRTSTKYNIRKNFTYNGTADERNKKIEQIKSTIKTDYIDVPNEKWQLGHKNPDMDHLDGKNMVLQPPIQCKYRDDYIWIDTLTKMPMPNKLQRMVSKGEIPLTLEQISSYRQVFDELFKELQPDNKWNSQIQQNLTQVE
jgi:hypothetical protein